MFVEKEVEEYFDHFQRTAVNMKWSKQYWSMLLQTMLSGKAQRMYVALATEDCADYEIVKATILKNMN